MILGMESITFQVIDWFTTDIEDDDCDESDSGSSSEDDRKKTNTGYEPPIPKSYLIKLFGMDERGQTISLNVTGFQPYFYIKLPRSITNQEFDSFSRLLEKYQHSMVDLRVIRKKDLWGFTNGTLFWFLKLTFKNHQTMRFVERVFSKPITIYGLGKQTFPIYESNIEPFIRFIHRRGISPCGWVRVSKYAVNHDILPTHCKINITTDWKNIVGIDQSITAPFVIASFDLECTSSHGDFPVAKKDYLRLAREIADLYRSSQALKGNPTLLRKTIRQGIIDAFDVTRVPSRADTFSVLYPIKPVRLAKIINVIDDNLMSIIDTLKGNIHYDDEPSPADDDSEVDAFEYLMNRGNGNDSDDDTIPSHDKVVLALNDILSANFPLIQGDVIIQIGTVFQAYGSNEPRRVIMTLGSCAPLAHLDIEVIECQTEREMILKWGELIIEQDPDIIIGYNIFGFDMNYLAVRAVELGCEAEFMQLGRIKGRVSPYIERSVSSSAMGDNLYKMIQMDGRVSIDLMKSTQRDHKLDSYKLDHVSSIFMKGAILKIEENVLTVDQLTGIATQDYIKLGNGMKVMVTAIDAASKRVTIDGPSISTLSKSDMTWGLAKDDITPQQIFECQKGSSDDRALIAKYCIQDCQLCIYLMLKLQILANNFGMANVCTVPLSYIFQRGQSVKIFSLVSKQAAADGFLIPTIRPARNEEGNIPDEDEGYEGAIVLDPVPGVYIEDPISVLDYASLYPSSMISENISHDSIILNPKFDNLPGIEYLDIVYDQYEGKGDKKHKVGERVCRYAQFANGEKGIIPRILQTLLTARKTTRKKMEEKTIRMCDGTVYTGLVKSSKGGEDTVTIGEVTIAKTDIESIADSYDDFQKAVLDGLQLAYKLTANSVYGQVGAKTSPIHMKDLAASTTATGRALILKAKAFLEAECGARIIYGDSVMPYTPITMLRNGKVHVSTIEDMATNGRWLEYPQFKAEETGLKGKEQHFPEDIQVWTPDGWAKVKRVIRHLTTKKIYRIITQTGLVDVTEDHSLLTPDGEQVKPDSVEVGQSLLHSQPVFPDSVDVPEEPGSQVYAKTQVTAQSYNVVLQQLGYTTSIINRNDIYRISYTKLAQEPDACVIKKIELLFEHYGGYVYDLETEAGVFHAGVGNLIVKNTDSVFAIFPNEELRVDPHTGAMERVKLNGHAAIMKSIELAQAGSDLYRKTLKKPHDLEYEKTFFPFIILSKKRYVGNKYEFNDKKYKQNSMGIVMKRRDNANIVKHIYGGILDLILNHRDVKGSIAFLNTCLQELIDGKVAFDQLVITKTLKGSYKNPQQIAHKVLADRMKERDPGSAPQSNDRIPYIYVRTPAPEAGAPKQLQGERIETPDYIVAKKLEPDYEHYMTNQIMKPVVQLFALVLEQLKGYKLPADHWTRVKTELGRKNPPLSDKKIRQRISRLRENATVELLFGPYLTKLSNRKQNLREISSFFKPKAI